jgi:hypothetical protein
VNSFLREKICYLLVVPATVITVFTNFPLSVYSSTLIKRLIDDQHLSV